MSDPLKREGMKMINVTPENLQLMATIICITAQLDAAKEMLSRLEYQWQKCQDQVLLLLKEMDDGSQV